VRRQKFEARLFGARIRRLNELLCFYWVQLIFMAFHLIWITYATLQTPKRRGKSPICKIALWCLKVQIFRHVYFYHSPLIAYCTECIGRFILTTFGRQ
jgi:hypothetical protein